jgi:hypothetical protein
MFQKDLRAKFPIRSLNWVRGFFMKLLEKALFSIMKGKALMPE